MEVEKDTVSKVLKDATMQTMNMEISNIVYQKYIKSGPHMNENMLANEVER